MILFSTVKPHNYDFLIWWSS